MLLQDVLHYFVVPLNALNLLSRKAFQKSASRLSRNQPTGLYFHQTCTCQYYYDDSNLHILVFK